MEDMNFREHLNQTVTYYSTGLYTSALFILYPIISYLPPKKGKEGGGRDPIISDEMSIVIIYVTRANESPRKSQNWAHTLLF